MHVGSLPGAGGGENEERLFNRSKIFFRGDKRTLGLDIAGGLHNTMNALNSTDMGTLKWFILCEFHL